MGQAFRTPAGLRGDRSAEIRDVDFSTGRFGFREKIGKPLTRTAFACFDQRKPIFRSRCGRNQEEKWKAQMERLHGAGKPDTAETREADEPWPQNNRPT